MLAENEFKEFITFYPTNARVDYAQYKLAMTHFRRMRAPERDQTETIAAVREFEVFFDRYPNSMLTPEVREKWREARNRLSEASYKVGLYYYRARWYPGAIDRFKEVLKTTPDTPAGTPCTTIWRNLSSRPIRKPKQSRTTTGWSRNSTAASISRMPANGSKRWPFSNSLDLLVSPKRRARAGEI